MEKPIGTKVPNKVFHADKKYEKRRQSTSATLNFADKQTRSVNDEIVIKKPKLNTDENVTFFTEPPLVVRISRCSFNVSPHLLDKYGYFYSARLDKQKFLSRECGAELKHVPGENGWQTQKHDEGCKEKTIKRHQKFVVSFKHYICLEYSLYSFCVTNMYKFGFFLNDKVSNNS